MTRDRMLAADDSFVHGIIHTYNDIPREAVD